MKHLKTLAVIGLILLGAIPIIATTLVGTEDNGASSGSITALTCSEFAAAASGTATSIWARSGDDFGSANWTMAIYASGGTLPTGAPIASSTAVTAVSAANTLYQSNGLTCAVACAITASTDYWVCVWSDSANVEGSWAAGTTNQTAYDDSGETHPNWPTWNGVLNLDRQYDIYVDGTVAGGGAPAGSMGLMGVGR